MEQLAQVVGYELLVANYRGLRGAYLAAVQQGLQRPNYFRVLAAQFLDMTCMPRAL